MNRTIHILLITISMLIFTTLPVLADTGTINSGVVNIRSGPGTNYPVAGSAYQGTEVSILESGNGWYKVQLGQLTGWLSASLLDIKQADITVTVKGDLANLRTGPGTNFDKAGQVVKGDTLILLEVQNDWYKVKTLDGKIAFVAAFLMNSPADVHEAIPANPSANTSSEGYTSGSVAATNNSQNPIQGSGSETNPVVFLDNKELIFDVPPIIENDRTLVPLRAIFEAMGAAVDWDNASRTVTAKKGSTTVVLTIGSTSPTINGVVNKLDVPGKIVGDRTLAPLRFVGEAFQGTVGWDGATRTVSIVSPPEPLTPENTGTRIMAVIANEDLVNLRSGPSLNEAQVDRASRGETMSVLSEQDGWYQVSRGGRTAWVSGTVVTLAWQENEPPAVPVIAEPAVNNQNNSSSTVPETISTSADAVRVLSAKNDKGLQITIGSGTKMEISKEQSSTRIKYEIKNRHTEGNTYFTENLDGQFLEVRAQDQGDNAIVEITIPSSVQYHTASEDDGKKEIITIPNYILSLERKTFGSSGEKLVLTTLFPLTYTNSQQGTRMQLELDQLLLGKAQSEYSYGSTLLNRVTFRNQGSSDSPKTIMEIETNNPAKFAFGKNSDGNILNIAFIDQNEVQQRSAVIVIDPGHGGSEPGASGDFLKEKQPNLDISLKVAALLRQRGMEVVLTREDDSFVSLEDRSSMANLYNARLFVSIHNNYPGTPDKRYTVQGTETHYYAPLEIPELFMQSAERCRLATCIQEQMAAKLQRPNRGVKTGSPSNYSVLRNTQMPSALAEVCFIGNPEEEQLLMQDYFKTLAAEAIADGITNYCNGTGGSGGTSVSYQNISI